MGTRADFYIGTGASAEWLGSIAYDGWPGSIPDAVLRAETEEAYRVAVVAHITSLRHGTLPEDGWPWPWEDSSTSDYGYRFDPRDDETPIYPGVTSAGHNVWWHGYAIKGDIDRKGWHTIEGDFMDEAEVWPDMTARKNVAYDQRSGALWIVAR